MSRRDRKRLNEEDEILWRKVQRTVVPLHARPAPLTGNDFTTTDTAIPNAVEKPGSNTDAGNTRRRRSFAAPPYLPPKPEPAAHRDMDRPTRKKIAKGRISIDARIDLHNMTQHQAHDRLYTFLADSRSRGLRYVLVVTGKGRSPGSERMLKRMVPVWLTSNRFAGLTSGYSDASRQHGGEGAIYIRLRRLSQADGSRRP